MSYIKRKARNVGFHSKRHAERAGVGEVQRVLTRIAAFGMTTVTVKRHAQAFKHIAEAFFPKGTENFRERRPGVLHLTPEQRRVAELAEWNGLPQARRRVSKLRANYAGRMAEVG